MGKIIVIEGTDSSGKETQTKLLYERVKKIYDKTIKISFPNYDSPACEPVKMYLAGAFGTDATKVNPYPISTMYAIDRYASFKQDWEKKYIDDYIIITDRYVTSNMIHQASKIEDIKEKDESSMSKKEYFTMIDRARAEKKHEISREDMRKMLMGGLKNEFAANA